MSLGFYKDYVHLMSLEQYRLPAILFSIFTFFFGFVAYVFILQEPSSSQSGMSMLSSGVVVPTHNFFATEGWVRTVLGYISLLLALFFGLGSMILTSKYIDLKKRS